MRTRELLIPACFLCIGLTGCDDAPADPTGRLDLTLALGDLDPSVRYLHLGVDGEGGEVGGLSVDLLDPSTASRESLAWSVACEPGARYHVSIWGSEATECTNRLWNLERDVPCKEGANVVPIAGRELRMGLASCAVDLEEVLCTAKIESRDEFLPDPATGERGPTMIVAGACSDSDGDSLFVYATDARITCGDQVMVFPAASAPVGHNPALPPFVDLVAKYAGEETFGSGDSEFRRSYVNLAFLFDLDALADASCSIEVVYAMSERPFVDGAPPAEGDVHVIELVGPIVVDGQLVERSDATMPGGPRLAGREALAGRTFSPVDTTVPGE